MMFVKVLLLVAAVSADNRPIAANGDWEDCDNWTVGCPASNVAYNAVIDKAIVFDTSDPNGHSEGTEITIETNGMLTIDVDCVFIIGDTGTHAPTKSPTQAPTLQCTCTDGIGASGVACPSAGAAKCASCDDGYYLDVIAHDCTAFTGDSNNNAHWEDASMICAAGSDLATCAFPLVTSDGIAGSDTTGTMTLTVTKVEADTSTTTVFTCTGPGTPGCEDTDVVAASGFNFDATGYYMFTYSALDQYGNTAEDIVFSLFLDDWVAPTITGSGSDIQACNPTCGVTCTPVAFQAMDATDTVNGDVSPSLKYSFAVLNQDQDQASRSMAEFQDMTLAEAQAQFLIEQYHPVSLSVTAQAEDSAGAFGQGGASNTAHAEFAFNIVDNIAPVITVTSPSVNTLECAKHDYTAFARADGYTFAPYGKFADPGATFFDQVTCTQAVNTITSTVDTTAIGTYSVTYDASGWNHVNSATQATREVVVQDTTPPLIALIGFQSIEIHQYDKNSANFPGTDTEDDGSEFGTLSDWTAASLNAKHLVHSVQVWDECSDISVASDVAITYLSADEQTPYATSERMAEAPGTYIVRYTATDGNGLTSSIDRSVTVVDNTAPIIRLAGASRIFVEFKTGSFTDPSATCKDYNNDLLNVVTTGVSDVDTTTLGTYLITYSCTDGINAAHSQVLTVIVRDTTAPTFVIALGGGAMTTDTAKLATVAGDIQWGNINNAAHSSVTICENQLEAGFPFKDPSCTASDYSATTVSVSNNIVTESASKAWNMESCAAIKAFYAEATDGYYFITTSVSGTVGKVRVLCAMTASTPTTTKACTGSCTCAGLGMTQESTGVCTSSSTTIPTGYTISHDAVVSGAHLTEGSYVFQYYIVDAEGNTNDCWNHYSNRAVTHCQGAMTYVRLVTVTDNLPPVITLHDRANENAVLYAAAGLDNANPFVQGALMAEQSNTMNGWIIAAAGCAVAGLALMAVSSKKSALVPV